MFKKLIQVIQNKKCECSANVSVDIPQPLEVSGDLTCISDIPQPLSISGSVSCEEVSIDIPQPLEVSGTVTCISSDECVSDFIEQLSKTSSYTEIVFKNGEQYQKVTDVTISGNLITFISQSQTIIAPICNIEYAVL